MGVVSKSPKANIQVIGLDDKIIATYSGVNPSAHPNAVEMFGEAVGMVRGEAVGAMYLNTTAELADEGENI